MKKRNFENDDKVNNYEETVMVERNYKDTVFRMLFNDKEKLLELYNAVNNTHYTNADDLKINTLQNAVYMNMKNDVSCVFQFYLNIYEHQSTNNPNMPLRNLFYVAKLLQRELTEDKNLHSLYSSKLIKIPTPRFVVFYNGIDADLPDKTIYKLSDSFIESTNDPELELIVTVLNINIGKNKELLEQCKTLNDYCKYVDCIRKFSQEMSIEEAVNKAVDYCIKSNILADFLKKNKAEVISMSITECNYEEEIKKLRLIEREEGSKLRLLEQVKKKLIKGKNIELIAAELEQPVIIIQKCIDEMNNK